MASGLSGASLRKSGPLDKEFSGTEGMQQCDTEMSKSGLASEHSAHISGDNSTKEYITPKASMGTLGTRGQAEG